MPSMLSPDLMGLILMNRSMRMDFVADAVEAAAEVATECAHQSLLVQLPVASPFGDFDQDIEIKLNEPLQFLRMVDAWNNRRIRFAVRSLGPEPWTSLFANRGYVPCGLFGFVGNYCVICVQLHPRLDCVTVQFC